MNYPLKFLHNESHQAYNTDLFVKIKCLPTPNIYKRYFDLRVLSSVFVMYWVKVSDFD